MSCGGVSDTNFSNRQLYGLGEGKTLYVHSAVTPTTDTNKALCWTAGFFKPGCPTGWTFVDATGEGCDFTQTRSKCKYNDYPTDAKTKARCCLGVQNVGTMTDTGSFPANAQPCPPNYCLSNVASVECRNNLEQYCTTQYPFGSQDHDACWNWAKNTGNKTLDNFCRDDGAGNGSALSTNKECKDYVNDKLSYGKMDNSVTAYCASDLSKTNAQNGEKLCSCFSERSKLPEDQLRLVKTLGAPLGCWDPTCREFGYYSTPDLERSKNCGNFCGSANTITVAGSVLGDVNSQVTCIEKAKETQQNVSQILNQQQQAQQMQTSSSASSSSKILILLFVGFVLLIVIIIAFVAWITSDEDDQSASEPQNQQFSDYSLPYQIEQPQQIYMQP